jgi:hypothetical protein
MFSVERSAGPHSLGLLAATHVVKAAAPRFAAAVAAAWGFGLGTAHADGESALSVSVGWATFSAPGKPVARQAPASVIPDIGGALAIAYERAISGDFSLRGELAGGVFYGGGPAGAGTTSFSALGDAGLTYRFDVLKYVPYAFAGLGGVTVGGGPVDQTTNIAVVIGGGVDWLRSRERSYGLEARLATFGGDITLVTVGLRGTLRWGFL